MTEVIVRNGNIDGALRLLTKKLTGEGTLRLARQRSRFESRSDRRRRKLRLAQRRARREAARSPFGR